MSARLHRRSRRARRAGFTLMEVMIAVGLMTVGALAIMAMQQASTRGNIEARQIGTASEITSRWVERLRRDALAWTEPQATTTALGTASASTGASGALGQITTIASGGTTTNWFVAPDGVADGDIGPAFDWMGIPVGNVAANQGQIRYCTYLRLTWVREGSLMRADVLTWWHRRGAGGDPNVSNLAAFPLCGAAAPAAVIADLSAQTTVLRSVQGSTLLRWTRRRL